MYIERLNRTEFTKLAGHIHTVIMPIGMTEAHGPHCPLGTDTLIPLHFCEMLEKRLSDRVLIAPAIPYGHSWGLSVYPGTVDVDAAVFQNYVRSVGEGFLKWGLDHIIFMNGHGGNVSSLSLAGEQLADQGAKVLTMNWWLDYSAEIKTVCQAQGHAGEDETSTVLAIEEKLVDMKLATENWARLRGNIKWKGMGLETYVDALSGDARLATREKGEKIYELLADRMYELITCFQRDDFMLRG